MIFISYLLKALLALILAYLGGAFLRNVRGFDPDRSGFERSQDRLLGSALYVASLFLGVVACQRLILAGGAESESKSSALLPVALVFSVCWVIAALLGLRPGGTLAAVRYAVVAAVVTLALFLVTSNGQIMGTDVFLGLGLVAWLVVTLMGRRTEIK